MLPRNPANLGNRLDGPDLVVRVHHGNQDRTRSQSAPHILRIDAAESINRHESKLRSEPFQKSAGIDHRWMLHLSRNDVRALCLTGEEDPLQRLIIGLASTTCEDNLSGVAPEERGNLRPGLLPGIPRGLARPVIAGWIPERLVQHRPHPSGNLRRYRRAGIEIKINTHKDPSW
jgi:hypothetical protein